MRVLLLEPFSGISGDMLLGALVDVGVPMELLQEQVDALGLSDRIQLKITRTERGSISATKVDVLVDGESESPGEATSSGSHHATRAEEVLEQLTASSLDRVIVERASKVFTSLIEAESRVHGDTPGSVHLHEAGALDAVVDVVCGVAAVSYLGVDRVISTPPHDGHGEIETSHGILPVPVPATAYLLEGVPQRHIDVPFEMVTPTGAALLTTLVDEFRTVFTLIPERVGYGAGTRVLNDRPNVLRVSVGEMLDVDSPYEDRVTVLETTVDDALPEMWPHLVERLLEAGARDAYMTHVVMKKGRPGIHLTVLADRMDSPVIEKIIFEETGTLGIRITSADRRVLERTTGILETGFGSLRVKLSRMPGEQNWRVHPEFEACRKIAVEHGIPLREVYLEVGRVAVDRDRLRVDDAVEE